tara:strand:- start:1293 stop:2621 length:1329 start_codon:yes stop_codon:yes gene_type:complete
MHNYIEFLRSSTYLINYNNTKILFDPWLEDGEYYGSWSHFPPKKISYDEFSDIDLICLTHIHPDHFSKKTFNKLNKRIPVLISNYKQKFLKFNLEKLGFKVLEIDHENFYYFKDFKIYSFAADNCDPEICMKFFGCGAFGQKEKTSNQIDSIFLIEVDNRVILNVNDVPYNLAEKSLSKIKEKFPKIDLLFTGYAGAGPYPQCFENLSDETKKIAAKKKEKSFLEQARSYIDFFEPNYFIPFAGTYTLSGKLYDLNELRGVPDIQYALNYLNERTSSKGILFQFKSLFDLDNFELISKSEKNENITKYINYFKSKKLEYEDLEYPDEKVLIDLFSKSYLRFENYRKEINYSSETQVFFKISIRKYIKMSANGSGYNVVSENEIDKTQNILIVKIDTRLFFEILKGPRYAHWNNAEIGSHIKYFRNPDAYDRGLFYCMNFLHS